MYVNVKMPELGKKIVMKCIIYEEKNITKKKKITIEFDQRIIMQHVLKVLNRATLTTCANY